jgi:probable phosphoglycerate mutase
VPPSYPQRSFALPPDAKEVILLRHGASAPAIPDEPFDLVGGHSDPPLAAEGEQQAAAAAQRLATEPIEAIYVTPLQRTAQTAAPLTAATGLEPVVIEDLREVHLGEWEGGEFRIRMHHRDPVALKALMEERWDAIPGAETMDSLAERVAAGVQRILEATSPGARAVAVLHGGVIGEICRQVTRSRPFAFIHADNASISRLVELPQGIRLLRTFNDTAHLEGPRVST